MANGTMEPPNSMAGTITRQQTEIARLNRELTTAKNRVDELERRLSLCENAAKVDELAEAKRLAEAKVEELTASLAGARSLLEREKSKYEATLTNLRGTMNVEKRGRQIAEGERNSAKADAGQLREDIKWKDRRIAAQNFGTVLAVLTMIGFGLATWWYCSYTLDERVNERRDGAVRKMHEAERVTENYKGALEASEKDRDEGKKQIEKLLSQSLLAEGRAKENESNWENAKQEIGSLKKQLAKLDLDTNIRGKSEVLTSDLQLFVRAFVFSQVVTKVGKSTESEAAVRAILGYVSERACGTMIPRPQEKEVGPTEYDPVFSVPYPKVSSFIEKQAVALNYSAMQLETCLNVIVPTAYKKYIEENVGAFDMVFYVRINERAQKGGAGPDYTRQIGIRFENGSFKEDKEILKRGKG